jgi:hypothetical protein
LATSEPSNGLSHRIAWAVVLPDRSEFAARGPRQLMLDTCVVARGIKDIAWMKPRKYFDAPACLEAVTYSDIVSTVDKDGD